MENWRGFLHESLSADSAALNQLALIHDKSKDVQTLVLYIPGTQPPKLVAAIEIARTQDQCIPETYQVEWTFTMEQYRRRGLGEMMYGICFFLVNRLGIGLTSDQNTSTSKAAGRQWARLVGNKELTPRKTPFGNDTFDYDGNKTPKDPFDDCGLDGDPPEGDGIDQSMMMKNYSKYADMYRRLNRQHQQFLTVIPVDKQKQFQSDIVQDAVDEFSYQYDQR